MSSPKNRDLAKELVDFLLKEKKKDSSEAESGETKTKNKTEATKAADDQKTLALAPETALAKIPIAPLVKSPPPTIEFDLDVGEKGEDIDFSQKSAISKNILEKVNKAERATVTRETKSGPGLQETSDVAPKAKETESHPAPFATSGRGQTIFKEVSTLVGGVEAIRVAQARIAALERERDQLRDETEKLLTATEGFQRRIAEMKALQEASDRAHRERVEILEEEKIVMRGRLSARENELAEVKKQLEELQSRFQNDLHKIRARERELENRQELLKAESMTIIRSKDEMILELKRQLDQLQFEIDNFRAKSSDLDSRINEFQDRNHRTVKALRLALGVLEGGENEDKPKKASGQ